MAEQHYWDDWSEGQEIPEVQKIADRRMLVMFAGASGDFNPLHYDDHFGDWQGSGVIVHGALKYAWLGQLMMNFVGLEGKLKRLGCSYRGQDIPRRMKTQTEPEDEGDTWRCRGVITRKYEENGEALLDLDVWVENSKGEKTTPGTATCALPKRS